MFENIGNSITFNNLPWDEDYFNVTSAKAIFHNALTKSEWNNLKTKLSDYEYITIVNENSEPINSQYIGKETSAFLADINIQFEKEITESETVNKSEDILIYTNVNRNNHIINLAEFEFSRFIEDPELKKRGGEKVYRQWLKNSFGKPNKYFAISKNEKDLINGFVLFSYNENNTCTIELIAVSKEHSKKGIGTKLLEAVESAAYKNNCHSVKVGTQIRNLKAINFYNKAGYRQIGCHQIYHLWNL